MLKGINPYEILHEMLKKCNSNANSYLHSYVEKMIIEYSHLHPKKYTTQQQLHMKTPPHLHGNRKGSFRETAGQLMISPIENTESLSANNDITEAKGSR